MKFCNTKISPFIKTSYHSLHFILQEIIEVKLICMPKINTIIIQVQSRKVVTLRWYLQAIV